MMFRIFLSIKDKNTEKCIEILRSSSKATRKLCNLSI